jgi:hypothetical protein
MSVHALCHHRWSRFNWTEAGSAPITFTSYQHWGRYREGSLVSQEPNNRTRAEFCGVANASQTYQKAWGWADANCTLQAPFICKVCALGSVAAVHPLAMLAISMSYHLGASAVQPTKAMQMPRTHLPEAQLCGPWCDNHLPVGLQVRPPVVSPAYTAKGGRSTFFVNTSLLGFADAEAACRTNGGHLATFQVGVPSCVWNMITCRCTHAPCVCLRVQVLGHLLAQHDLGWQQCSCGSTVCLNQ